MAWNTPGSNNKQPSGWGPQQDNKGPPDIEALLKRLFRRGNKPAGTQSGIQGWVVAIWTAIILVLLWAISGLYSVDDSQQAVVLQGNDTRLEGAGLHWYPRFFAQKVLVNTSLQTLNFAEPLPLGSTGVVNASLSLQYQITDPEAYVLNASNGSNLLAQLWVSASYQAFAQAKDSFPQTQALIDHISTNLNQALSAYKMGVTVKAVQITAVNMPESVKAAAENVAAVQASNNKALTEAQTYVEGVNQKAEQQAAAVLRAANNYKKQAVLQAQTEVAQFNALLPIYQSSPEATAMRLYFDTMQQVLSSHAVIVSDANVIYLPAPTPVASKAAPEAPQPPLKAAASDDASSDQASISHGSNETAMSDYDRWESAQ